MEFEPLELPGLFLVTPRRHGDDRGWFSEIFREDLFRANVCDADFVQHNQSFSAAKGTVRGLHFQIEPRAQGKLVRCARGRILDVAVDLRASSPTYGRHVAVELTSAEGRQLWIPAGFAHGFCTLEANCELAYLVTDYYSPAHDRGVAWDDPDLAVEWPIVADEAAMSAKDRKLPSLRELGTVFA